MIGRKTPWLSGSSLVALGLVAASILLPVSIRAEEHGVALMVAPTRVVFEGNKRTAAVNVTNTGTETATYRIMFVQRRMREDGSFEPIDTPAPGERFADQLVYFAPRMVVLPPGGQQTVRLQLRKPAGLGPGEYRSHLLFQAVPAGAAGNDIEELASGGAGADGPARRAPRALSMRIARSGNRSVYGDVTVSLVAADGREQIVGSINGIAVYTHIDLAVSLVYSFRAGREWLCP